MTSCSIKLSYLVFIYWEQRKLKWCMGGGVAGLQSTERLVIEGILQLSFLFISFPLSHLHPVSPFFLTYLFSYYIFCMRSSQFLVPKLSLELTGRYLQPVILQLSMQSRHAIILNFDQKRKYRMRGSLSRTWTTTLDYPNVTHFKQVLSPCL